MLTLRYPSYFGNLLGHLNVYRCVNPTDFYILIHGHIMPLETISKEGASKKPVQIALILDHTVPELLDSLTSLGSPSLVYGMGAIG